MTSIPPGWSLTLGDLMDELKTGKRKQIGQEEMKWARAFERSLIPAHYRFSKKGDLYEARTDQSVAYLTAWSAAYTGGGSADIFKGEQFWIDSDNMEAEPTGAYLLAVDYCEMEKRIIPATDRNALKYEGYYFHVSTIALNENFKLLKTGFKKEKYR